VDTANSVEVHFKWIIPSYLVIGSVETLHGEAEMPKIKSSRQAQLSGQGNLMSEAKQRVARSSRARRINLIAYENHNIFVIVMWVPSYLDALNFR